MLPYYITMEEQEYISELKEFFNSNKEEFAEDVKSGKIINLDYMLLAEECPDVCEEMTERPEETISIIESVVNEIDWMPDKSKVRLSNLCKSMEVPIREIRAKHLGRLISITGIIRQASEVRPKEVSTKFECPSCGTIISVLQNETKHKVPKRCSCGRHSGFKELSKDMVDSQSISVEEPHDSLEHSTQPKKIKVILHEDLAEPQMENKTTPGSGVNVIGILKEIERTKNGTKSLVYEICIDANNIVPLKEDFENIEVTEEDVREILEISKDNPLDAITKSFAPSICGHESVKRALVLQLFGGNRIVRKDGTTRRGDIHMLLVGDPSAGKSQLLKYTANLAPKSRYVSGMSTSGVGLTATVTKDEVTGDWTLQAGAMVLANNGHILIDELDKMNNEDRSNLHEAMSIQTITVSKATVQAILNTRTSVLAAANPKFGRFDNDKPIAKQINLVPTLLSRFDGIFIMRDIPNEELDDSIAEHILSEGADKEAPLDSNLIRKYVSYAKKNIVPKMTREAIDVIKKFYVGLRNKNKGDAIPIGARQLEALVRLAEASAKLRLSKKVSIEDAKVAIDVMIDYLSGVGFDSETGELDVDKIYGTGSSERKKMQYVLRCIEKMSEMSKNRTATEESIKEMIGDKLTEDEIDNALYKLNRAGDILKTSLGFKKL